MGRFLTISTPDTGGANVKGDDGMIIASFPKPMHANQFCAAVACRENNPDARADEPERMALFKRNLVVKGLIYVTDSDPMMMAAKTVAMFTDHDDADLFIEFMRL